MTKFRVTIPTTKTFYDGGPASGVPKTEQCVLWAGDERPSSDTLLGLDIPVSGEIPLRSISGLPGSGDTLKIDVGDDLRIQRRRIARPLGWSTLERVHLPLAEIVQ